jgi:hypothetical protein
LLVETTGASPLSKSFLGVLLATLIEARLKQEARIAELEVKLAELEPYRTFVEQVRQKIRHEEYDE